MPLASKERRAAIAARQRSLQEVPTVEPTPDLDPNKINAVAKDLGVKATSQNFMQLARAAFPDQDLEAAGIAPEALQRVGELGAQKKSLEGQVGQAQQFLPTGLSVYERALKTKQGIGKPKPGGSELFKDLGIKGFGALTADLAQKATENQQQYNSFSQALGAVGQQFSNEFQFSLARLDRTNKEYDTLVERIDNVLAEQRQWTRDLELLDKQSAAFKEREQFKKDLEGGEVGDPIKRGDLIPGYGQVTVNGGSSGDWKFGLDIGGTHGQPIQAKVGGEITYSGPRGDFGNQVRIKHDDGTESWYSHLADVGGKVGDRVEAGQQIGTMGNTGNTQDLSGRRYTEEEKAANPQLGTHLDFTINDANGNPLSVENARNFLLSGKVGATGEELSGEDKLLASGLAVKLSKGKQGTFDALLPLIEQNMKDGQSIDDIEDAFKFAGQSKLVTGINRTVIERPLLSTKFSDKEREDNKDSYDRLLSAGEWDEARDLLKAVARNSVNQGEKSNIVGVELTTELVRDIQNDLKILEDNGIDTNIFSGTEENAIRAIGAVKNEEMRTVANKIQNAIMRYRNSITGKAFTKEETKEYKEIFPTISSTAALNSTKIQALLEVFDIEENNFYERNLGKNPYNTIFKGEGFLGETTDELEAEPTVEDENYLNSLSL